MIRIGLASRISLALLGAVLLAACGADREPSILIIPSSTPTAFTPAPTLSPTPTIFMTATNTLEPPTPFPTPIPRSTSLSGDFNPIQVTFTPAPATITATFLPTLVGIQIEYFVTNVDQIMPGDTITLFWRAIGVTSTTIFRLDAEGKRTQFWDAGPEGRMNVRTDANETGQARFLLRAQSGAAQVEKELVIDTACAYVWFVETVTLNCADSPTLIGIHVEQSFDHGRMIWVSSTREIYVIFTDGAQPTWQQFEDTYEDTMPIQDDTLVPPMGRLQPVRGFGLLWRENQSVRDRLGWALSSEAGYQGTLQSSGGDMLEVYVTALDGNTLYLQPGGDRWSIITSIPITPTPDDITPESTSQ